MHTSINRYAYINRTRILLERSAQYSGHDCIALQFQAHKDCPPPSHSSIRTSYLTQDGRGGQAEPRGHNWGCIWGGRYCEDHLHFSMCVFTDRNTISCSIWRVLTANLGLKCNLWGSQRTQPPQRISTQKPWTLFG